MLFWKLKETAAPRLKMEEKMGTHSQKKSPKYPKNKLRDKVCNSTEGGRGIAKH